MLLAYSVTVLVSLGTSILSIFFRVVGVIGARISKPLVSMRVSIGAVSGLMLFAVCNVICTAISF